MKKFFLIWVCIRLLFPNRSGWNCTAIINGWTDVSITTKWSHNESNSSESIFVFSSPKKLETLLSEHKELDDMINSMITAQVFDQLQLQRLKKKKLSLKDEIIKLKALIVPDIIA